MPIYRKIPIEIEAFKLGYDPLPDWFLNKMDNNEVIIYPLDKHENQKDPFTFRKIYCKIKTLEGEMIGNYGDFIIKGINEEIYPCKPEIFHNTYEKVNRY